MKKALSMVMCLMLVLSAASAVALEQGEAVGTWYLNTVESDGMTFDSATLGMEMTIALNEDGTGEMSMTGQETQEILWSIDGDSVNVTNKEKTATMTYIYADGQLSSASTGATMYFGKEIKKLEKYAPGEPLKDVTEADFEGSWYAYLMEMMGLQLDPATIGGGQKLEITNGNIVHTLIDGDNTQSYEAKGKLEGNVLLFTASDGSDEGMLDYGLVIYEDGSIGYTIEQDGMVATVYFKRAE